MPKGGQALLVEVLGGPADRRSCAAWWSPGAARRNGAPFLARASRPDRARERATLAAYLAVNLPLAEEAAQAGGPGPRRRTSAGRPGSRLE